MDEKEEDIFAEKIIGKTMCEAADEGSLIEVQLAMDRKEGINIQDPQNGDSALMKAIKGGYKEIAQVLLDVGANVKLANVYGDTALHWACTRGFGDIVEELIHRGANIDAIGEYKNTPLHLACSNNHEEIVSLLLMEGANVTFCNDFGNDAIKMSSDHKIKMKIKSVRDEGDVARLKLKKELEEKIEAEQLENTLIKMKEEEAYKQMVEREAWIKSKVDEVLATEKCIDEEEAAMEVARLMQQKVIENERIANEKAARMEKKKKKSNKAKKPAKKKKK